MAARTGVEPEIAASRSRVIVLQIGDKTVLICEEAKSPVCCFRAELRNFRVRICPKTLAPAESGEKTPYG